MPEMSISRIGQLAITVSDVEKALSFYRDILGLRFLFTPAPTLAFLQAGEVRIMLSTPQGAGAVGANSTLYFHVTDIEAVYPSLVASGATAERAPQLAARMPDHELWLAFLRDPDGNLVGLMEEKRSVDP
jgi:methylmalonyl-CoA/ethylmalonyl-CoA epimerase